jgi:hypothetical protein
MRFRYGHCAGLIVWLHCRGVSPKVLLRLVIEPLEDDIRSVSDDCVSGARR